MIQVCVGEPNLEFVWVGDDAVDPLQQAQTLQILVSAGIKTREEARAELGLGGDAKAGLGKFNPNHDERGRFATADDAANSQTIPPDATTDDRSGGRSRAECLAICSELALPTNDFGVAFFRCVQHCLGEEDWPEWRKHFSNLAEPATDR